MSRRYESRTGSKFKTRKHFIFAGMWPFPFVASSKAGTTVASSFLLLQCQHNRGREALGAPRRASRIMWGFRPRGRTLIGPLTPGPASRPDEMNSSCKPRPKPESVWATSLPAAFDSAPTPISAAHHRALSFRHASKANEEESVFLFLLSCPRVGHTFARLFRDRRYCEN